MQLPSESVHQHEAEIFHKERYRKDGACSRMEPAAASRVCLGHFICVLSALL